MMNLKALPPELYNQEVIVTLKPATEAFHKYGRTLTGYLAGRLWAERFDKPRFESTVTGVILNANNNDITLSILDIENIERSTFLA